MVKRALFFMALIGLALLAACQPAVPYDQMPGGQDLYSSAQDRRDQAAQAIRQAELMEAAMTATAQAPIVHITETAAALAVQQVQAEATNAAAIQTQAGAATQTAVWWTPTANMTGTLDALAIAAAQTQTTLNLERERAQNDFKAQLPGLSFSIIVLVLAVVLMIVVRRARYQPAAVDARGNVLPILDIVGGTFTDPDRSPNFQGSIRDEWLIKLIAYWIYKRTGAQLMLPEITAERQDAVIERDQMIDLATRGLVGQTDQRQTKQLAGQQMMKQISENNLQGRFKVLDGTGHDIEVIDEQIVTVLDADWKEASRT